MQRHTPTEAASQRLRGSHSKVLFTPTKLGSLELKNRIVMAPMTRAMSPQGIPGENVAHYYRRRAEAGIGLIISEGSFIPHWSASHDDNAPRFYGNDALAGWRRVIDAVHDAGGRMFAQLWHVGLVRKPPVAGVAGLFDDDAEAARRLGPSGIIGGGGLPLAQIRAPATEREIGEIIEAYGNAAASAKELGFDGVEIHGAHGYLIDQFLWAETNRRTDRYGGDRTKRSRFGSEVIQQIRRRVGTVFPVTLRLSTWKSQDYAARLATTPSEWAEIVTPFVEAGIDGFHLSQRRFWEGEFGSDLNLAGWTRKLTGKPTITVGSVTLNNSMAEMLQGKDSEPEDNLALVYQGLERGDFDLVAVGRALIANPDWPEKIRKGETLRPYTMKMLASLD
ncbi:flavin oxidoreductase / NADH oxidase family protein [Burkholderia cenocepacia]|uniref:Flavin oxidoreductase / NADH oxidase family protein n=1 Tax=Burkholderia cenocepacia TaxID=95486 RepID=A0AAN0RY40_9BURK|nr:flavin oxidoreductase / NADH oxidase family protein [Burkholderia cenocepacia]